MKAIMPAKYIIRFDDICPTMNWDVWKRIEQILIQQDVDPILAVVPDNKDKNLMVGEADLRFWDVVRSWQARGWAIGIHGYQHTYVTDRAGLVGINNRSEFAGLDEHEQESKLNKALNLFQQEEITPAVWIAPGHSFDTITLRVLKKLKIDVVSDGFYLSPNTDSLGIIHIPQQLWRLRRMPFGLWTVCYHHNSWTSSDVDRFESDIEHYKHQITGLHSVRTLYRTRNRNLSDALFSRGCLLALQTRSSVRKLLAPNQHSVTITS
jgi:predicted deacetylase